MEAICKWCSEAKSISDFVKGQANYTQCKTCAAAKQRVKVNCIVCDKLVSYGNLSKHMFSHNGNNPLQEIINCECGKTIRKYSLPKHLLSKKHFENIILVS
ncbi:MAG TPA: hypothetical protein VKR58_14130 [Aquella sp.]|nr:hypothetical protein [Aquella sp.]